MQFWAEVFRYISKSTDENSDPQENGEPLLEMRGMIAALYTLDGRTGNNKNKPKKLLNMLISNLIHLHVKNQGANNLSLSLDLFSSSGKQMVDSINTRFGPLVKGMLPLKHVSTRLVVFDHFPRGITVFLGLI